MTLSQDYLLGIMKTAINSLCNDDPRFTITSPGEGYTSAVRFLQSEVETRLQLPKDKDSRYEYWLRYSSDRMDEGDLERFVKNIIATNLMFTDPDSRLLWLHESLERFIKIFPDKTHIANTGVIRVGISSDYFLNGPNEQDVIEAIANYLLLPIGVLDMAHQ